MRRTDGWQRLHVHAQLQAGLVTLADAQRFGIPETSFRRRCREQQWTCLGGGVHLLPGVPVTTRTTHHAALLSLGPSAAISHETAAALHALHTFEAPEGVHAVIPHGMDRGPAQGVIRHRSRRLGQVDVITVHGLRVTTPERTLVDIAATLPAWRLEAIALHARQRGQLDVVAVQAQLDRRPGLTGAGHVREALAALEADGADSILERRVRTVLVDSGLHPTTRPFLVRVHQHQLMVDLAFPDQQVAVECDGFAYHRDRAAFERDRQRWSLLRQAGWTVIWVTWQRLHERPGEVVEEVRRALSCRSLPDQWA